MEKYLINLETIPEQHRYIFAKINQCIKKAFQNPGKLIRYAAGNYYVVISGDLVVIDHQDDEGGEWIAIEQSLKAKWYSDPFPTLKELKTHLGI